MKKRRRTTWRRIRISDVPLGPPPPRPPLTLEERRQLLERQVLELLLLPSHLNLVVSQPDALTLLLILQLAAAHPGARDEERILAEALAQAIEGQYTASPALAEIARLGWERAAGLSGMVGARA